MYDDAGDFAIHAPVNERTAFLKKVYLHLFGAILTFVAVEAAIFAVMGKERLASLVETMIGTGYGWLIVLALFMGVSMLATKMATSVTSVGAQYAGLGIYIIAEAIIFIPLLFIAAFFYDDVILNAALITVLLFSALTAIVLMTGKDFSFLRGALMMGGFIILGLIVSSIIFGFSLGMVFTVAVIGFLCLSILYHTSNVLHHYHTTQHVIAALALFASFATLLYYVIMLLIQMSGDD